MEEGGPVGSAVVEMEMERLDQEIEKTKKQFYFALLEKKRRVKRTWLEISAMTNAHLLQTLPYRAMLGHVAQLTEERDKVIAEILESNSKEECPDPEASDETPQSPFEIEAKSDQISEEAVSRKDSVRFEDATSENLSSQSSRSNDNDTQDSDKELEINSQELKQ